MKTIEDKAKRYDEAIERAREWSETKNGYYMPKELCEEIFPEIKESEDEKIRKSLINHFRCVAKNGDTVWNNLDYDKVITWLEKQGEQKTAEEITSNPDYISPKDKALFKIATILSQHEDKDDSPLEEIRSILVDYGINNLESNEQKPAFEMKTPEESLGVDSDTYNKIVDECVYGEQNPAWSEEDEDNFKHLMDEIVCLGNSKNSANRLYYDKLIKFLDELKNRAQPREEWRDKDERMLDRLIAYFEKQVAFTDDDNPRYANWLKSLRPQNRWKPSDEQLDALWDSIKHNLQLHPVLKSLYNDLKKLKG